MKKLVNWFKKKSEAPQNIEEEPTRKEEETPQNPTPPLPEGEGDSPRLRRGDGGEVEDASPDSTEDAIRKEFDRIEALLESDPQEAYTRAKAILDKAQELGNRRLIMKSTERLGDAAHRALPFPESFKEAVKLKQEAANIALELGDEEYYACRQKELGDLYREIPTAASLRQALRFYRKAIKIFRRQRNQKGTASVRWNMGEAYRQLPTGSKSANLRRAIVCYHSALQFYTEQDYPKYYAGPHHSLGLAYRDYPGQNHLDNLKQAQDHLHIAASMKDKAEDVYSYTSTQNSL